MFSALITAVISIDKKKRISSQALSRRHQITMTFTRHSRNWVFGMELASCDPPGVDPSNLWNKMTPNVSSRLGCHAMQKKMTAVRFFKPSVNSLPVLKYPAAPLCSQYPTKTTSPLWHYIIKYQRTDWHYSDGLYFRPTHWFRISTYLEIFCHFLSP